MLIKLNQGNSLYFIDAYPLKETNINNVRQFDVKSLLNRCIYEINSANCRSLDFNVRTYVS